MLRTLTGKCANRPRSFAHLTQNCLGVSDPGFSSGRLHPLGGGTSQAVQSPGQWRADERVFAFRVGGLSVGWDGGRASGRPAGRSVVDRGVCYRRFPWEVGQQAAHSRPEVRSGGRPSGLELTRCSTSGLRSGDGFSLRGPGPVAELDQIGPRPLRFVTKSPGPSRKPIPSLVKTQVGDSPKGKSQRVEADMIPGDELLQESTSRGKHDAKRRTFGTTRATIIGRGVAYGAFC